MAKPKRRPIRDFFWRHAAIIAMVVMVIFIAGVAWVGYNYVLITRKFDSSRRWDLPSRIYSDATPLLPGLSYPKELLEPKLHQIGYTEVKREVREQGEYRFVDDSLEVYLQDFEYPEMNFSGFPVRVEFSGPMVQRIVRLNDGIRLKAIRFEPELITSIYDEVMEDRIPIPLSAVPQHLVDAILVTEDRAFFKHEGISLRGIIRAAWQNWRNKGVTSGGSTLTQQLVKNLYLTPERKWQRKVREIMMSIILELRYSKQEILEAYLNEIYLGQNGAVQINGVERASQIYFSKKARHLTIPEAATIAGMIRWPSRYSPLRNPEIAVDRRNLVLRMMKEQGKITEPEYRRYVATPLTRPKYQRAINSAPFFVDLVLKELKETYPQTQLQTEGLRIFTTLDTIMQRSAEESLTAGITALNKKYAHLRKIQAPLEGVVLTIEPGTGYVKALVGGRSYGRSQFNRAFQARRQPGSLFKPFVYVAAMDPENEDPPLTASTTLDDTPITVQTSSGAWRPQNYDGKFHGDVTVRRALAFSYNIPAVRAAIGAGVPNVIALASRIGVQSKLQPYPSISLGSFEVTPLEVAYAYSVFANGGVKAEPVSILAVVTRDGQVLEHREVKMKRVAPASIVYIMNDMLQDVLDYGTAARTRSLGFNRKFAGKTGTTNNYKDAWFVGYSPRILSLVWVGFDDGTSVRLAGSEAALPIWTSHLKSISGLVPDADFRRPDDVSEREIDSLTGMLATPYCPKVMTEVFVRGTEPRVVCTVHSGGDIPFWGLPEGVEPPVLADGTQPGEEAPREDARRKKKKSVLERIFGDIFGDD